MHEVADIFKEFYFSCELSFLQNKWLRVCVVNILTVVDTTFNVSEFYCKISPLVAPFLRESLIRMNDRAVVYHCLVEPIPRAIWEFVVGMGLLHYDTLACFYSAIKRKRDNLF